MMIISNMMAALLALWWILANRTAKTRYQKLNQVEMTGLRFRKLHAPFIGLIERMDFVRKFPMFVYRVQHSIQRAYGPKYGHEKMMLFLAEMFVCSWLALMGGAVMTLWLHGLMGIAIGCMLAIIIPFAQLKDLHEKVKLREQDILMELPEFLNKVVLLVGAGETVQKAIIHCTERKQSSDHPLYIELRQMIAEWNSGFSFQQAFEQFSKRCGVQEVSIFTTTVLLNFRRGGNDFVLSLRELSRVLWEKRKSLSRTKGEQASSKLVFPMVVIFLVIVIMVGAPSFMTMNL
ncbi:type II secretion system F family protein [Paenibacillus sp. An7]|uniref:type II secretion system F family protein n=1 Tax=Paenibacillus sp. An7 TaxID=2689577 RepID=UPI001F470BD6|nr:type II secretion system F family protein [Paenibacillus sp. An7]